MDVNFDEFIVKKELTKTNTANKFYTMSGQEDYLDQELNPRLKKDNDKTVAKALSRADSSSYKYLIKIGAYGKIYNPISIYDPDAKQPKFMTRVRKSEWEFKEVSPKVFDHYINFLRTKNMSWFNNAERELS
jgi:hypothetical protein